MASNSPRRATGQGTPALDTILERMRAAAKSPAVWDGREHTFGELLDRTDSWRRRLAAAGVTRGTVVAVHGDYSLDACALILALFVDGAVAVPFIPASVTEMPALMAVAGAERLVTLNSGREADITSIDGATDNDLVTEFRSRERPGLVVFTSGSTGVPKGVLHDGELLLRKFVEPRPGWRTVLFLSMDHLGGLNTLFASLAYGGVAVCLANRNPETVARAIAESGATLLPTTPTFLNLLSASGVWRHYDLSSIRLITYGTEAMPDATLARVRAMFPDAEIKQTYGLSELGVLRSKSEDSGSTWVRVGGPGFEVKIVDDVLWIRSESNMVGYLNAPSPFDDDGWMNTGDEVEVRGDYIRILGRRSDMINVGGQKVSPLDVESVLLQAPNVADAAVRGLPHQLMGQVVHATVSLVEQEDEEEAVIRLRRHCVERLPRFKVPVRFDIVEPEAQRGARFKKVRRQAPVSPT
jgi:acyl-CoA synthetase (AMP-forming)/AMP-acid ligase II